MPSAEQVAPFMEVATMEESILSATCTVVPEPSELMVAVLPFPVWSVPLVSVQSAYREVSEVSTEALAV